MTVNKKLKDALKDIAKIKPHEHQGNGDDTYLVFNYNTLPSDYGDDEPEHEIYYVQVHLYAPAIKNTLSMQRDIKRALYKAGFTWARVLDASDSDGQHIVFECQISEAVEVE